MRFAILSDIHSNLQAWNAVLLDLRSVDVDRIICLGDVVGYGPNPREVMESVYSTVDHLVLGNHDAALCGKMSDELFNEPARRTLDWTRSQLNKTAIQFLKRLPLTLTAEGFRCAHGDFAQPSYFDYVLEPSDAVPSWRAVYDALLFVGHTHTPAIFVLGRSGVPRSVETQDFAIEPHKRYLVNVGSVGQPRDGETRASYCIFDTERGHLFWRRIPFDIDAYKANVEAAGIPVSASYFLSQDPRVHVQPIRESLNFCPAASADRAATDVVEVQSIRVLKRRVRKWQVLTVALAAAAIVGIAAVAVPLFRQSTRTIVLADQATLTPLDPQSIALNQNMLTFVGTPNPEGMAVPGWTITLGNKRKQHVVTGVTTNAEPYFAVSSAGGDEVAISSRPFQVDRHSRLTAQALFRKSAAFTGDIAMHITSLDGSGEVVGSAVKQPNIKRKDGWWAAKHTPDLSAKAKFLHVEFRGIFTGTVTIKSVSLIRKE